MRFIILIIITIFCLADFSSVNGQIVNETMSKSVYFFLDQMSKKGIIEIEDQIIPLSRKLIASKLIELDTKKDELSGLEKEELEFYLKDYYQEFQFTGRKDSQPGDNSRMSMVFKDGGGRYRLFSYSDKLFKVDLDPILGIEKGSKDGNSYTHSWSGIKFYGYFNENIGFSFDYRDNNESGIGIDGLKAFTPETGISIALAKQNEIQYSEIHTSISADWSWGSITAAKEFLQWGYGESGKLVLSQKAPSFPFIRLDITPVKWLHFNYLHAWLNSGIIDSNASYPTYRTGVEHEVFRNKFLASHTLSFLPIKGLNISIGEAIVYSDKLEIAYLMPLMFFRLADHYLSQTNNDAGSNSQFFASVSSRNHIKNTHLYGTLYIDELTISGITDPARQRTQIGFTLGASVTDLPISRLTATIEYTKTYPFIYRHYIPTQTYTNSGYVLGHWMGDNADLIYASLNYRFIRGLQASIWAEHIRKGIYDFNEGIEAQYKVPQPPFLWGKRNTYTFGGMEVKYEIVHDLLLRARFQYNDSSEEIDPGMTLTHKSNDFYFAAYYGL